jgi:hypothetical protein
MNKQDYLEYLAMRERAIAPYLVTPPSKMPPHTAFAVDPPLAASSDEAEAEGIVTTATAIFNPAFESAEHLYFQNIGRTVPSCSAPQEAHNNRVLASMDRRLQLLIAIGTACDRIDGAAKSGADVERAITQFNSTPVSPSNYFACVPSGQAVVNAQNAFLDRWHNDINPKSIRASNQLFRNANGELAKLKSILVEVEQARSEFESATSGGSGITGIAAAHERFVTQGTVVSSFKFGNWWAEHNKLADAFSVASSNTHNAEAVHSTIDEVDRARDEYVKGNRPIPPGSAFTASKASPNFTFAELNSGEYNWAVISDRLLQGLEAVRTLVGGKPLSIGSAYRNPRRNDSLPNSVPNSRHQYGDAADVTPSDLNGDGIVDANDRDMLFAAAQRAGFTEVIKKNVSVHMAFD